MMYRRHPAFDRTGACAPKPAVPVAPLRVHGVELRLADKRRTPLRVHGVELRLAEFTFIRRCSFGILETKEQDAPMRKSPGRRLR